ncbi:MAG: M4 family metallopeptidase [Candidatus Obscuribacterales bacterium]
MSNHNHMEGFIPDYVLQDIARLNPLLLSPKRTMLETQKLFLKAISQQGNIRQLTSGGSTAQRKIYDAQNRRTLPGTRARFEGDAATGDAIVDAAYEFHGDTLIFVKEVMGRNSIDNQGMNLLGTVHYGVDYDNAFWNSRQMVYGDGDKVIFVTFVRPTVVGHELFHGITEHTSGLEYQDQSGALNESLSDVGGVLVRQYKARLSADKDSWLLGTGLFAKGINARALRDMLNPGTAYDDPKIGKDRQPAHMKDLYTGWGDNGGVHINSGIPNKAFATFAIAAGGYAWEAPFEVWSETAFGKNRVGSKAQFQDFADLSVSNCSSLQPKLVDKLVKAWDGVGIIVK